MFAIRGEDHAFYNGRFAINPVTPQTPIAPSTPGYNTNPTRGDAVHLALVVLPASDAMEAEVSDEVRTFLRYTRARGEAHVDNSWVRAGCGWSRPYRCSPHPHPVTLCPDLRTLVVLNKIDSLDPECASDLSTIYTSSKVLKMCCEASAACGVPINNVFPMKSYSNEYDTDYHVSYCCGGKWERDKSGSCLACGPLNLDLSSWLTRDSAFTRLRWQPWSS
jgi:hypothetical protein